MNHWNNSFLFFCFFFLLINESFASELMTTAKQIKKNTFSGQVYYTREKSKINFQVGTNQFSGEKEGEKIVLKFTYGLGINFYPWIKFGSNLKGYSLSLPSSTVTNEYLSSHPEWFWGVGSRLLVFPETIVNPAVSFDFGYTYINTEVDSFCLKIKELQGALLVSKQFAQFHSYAGFRITPLKNELIPVDKNEEKISGSKDNFSLFFGLAGNFFSYGKIFFEFALGDEQNLSLGLSLRN